MVQCASYTTKNIVMESLLRNAEQKFKGVAVAHDLTVKEREECKRMVAEAKVLASQDTSGEYLYRVRGYPSFHRWKNETDENKQNQSKELGTSKNISEGISIMHTNAHGLVNKRQELKALINSV